MSQGIYTLANDKVFDQVVALINSIEENAGKDFPVIIFPYDDCTERLKTLTQKYPQVEVFEDQKIIQRWDEWVKDIWATHPTAAEKWLAVDGKPGIHRMGTHRRLCAFDGPLDHFIYMDADTLLLQSPNLIFKALERVDWVTYDFQHKDLSHAFDTSSFRLFELFPEDEIKSKVFCSGFFGAKRNIVDGQDIQFYLEKLSSGEAEVLYPMAPDQTVLNYFVLRKPISSVNLALSLPSDQVTGNSVTSPHFEEVRSKVLDKGVPLLYLHYIGISSKIFKRLCKGENIDFPYRDTFLHYRYLKAPEERPQFQGEPLSYKTSKKASLPKRFFRKLGLVK
ncbi:Npun_R2821/Npun_R2822 family protein [Leptolyngbya iicbica]|uniref:Sugar transferase n=2 Tax=Cyanophyceae TaxID=3028117 RepID=A0A4Q7E448_9CYAN|nr:Npun_R2821/Npun_R2822 family protein [Leptolyngbya sp. LK]RZM76533.1 sugar transferase [Leptolyngbya sp. LK]